jgi:hypothetical protein
MGMVALNFVKEALLVDEIQVQKVGGNDSEQVEQCMDLEHCLHWLQLEPTHLELLRVFFELGASRRRGELGEKYKHIAFCKGGI